MHKKVCVIGEGSWGTAIATLLAYNGCSVQLWCHEPVIAQEITTKHTNAKYAPGLILDEKITATTSMKDALSAVKWVFEAIPITYLRSIFEHAKPFMTPEHIWVILSKGIEQKTLLFPSQMVDEIFQHKTKSAVLVGPSYAHDLVRKQITAISLAAKEKMIQDELRALVSNDFFCPAVTDDIIGVQIGAGLKNVMAVGIGMLEGAGYTDNTKAFFLTKALEEMVQLAQLLGGKQETIYGLAGLGDLILTCTGAHSRNREVGIYLGRGENLADILKKTSYIPEGINTLQSIHELLLKKALSLPLCSGIYEVIFSSKPMHQVLTRLMACTLSRSEI